MKANAKKEDPVDLLVLTYPLSILLMLCISIWLPVTSEGASAFISLPQLFVFFFLSGLICLPSAVIYFLLLRFVRPLRTVPFSWLTILAMALNLIPWLAFVHFMKSMD